MTNVERPDWVKAAASPRELEEKLRAAGFSKSAAARITSGGFRALSAPDLLERRELTAKLLDLQQQRTAAFAAAEALTTKAKSEKRLTLTADEAAAHDANCARIKTLNADIEATKDQLRGPVQLEPDTASVERIRAATGQFRAANLIDIPAGANRLKALREAKADLLDEGDKRMLNATERAKLAALDSEIELENQRMMAKAATAVPV